VAVSVIIPLYNKQRTVERAIRSIQSQTFQDLELIVVDDGSTDGSVDRLLATGIDRDPRFRLIRQANRGPGAARNEAARSARGRHLAFLDADDEWMPQYLQRAMSSLRSEPECRMFVAAYDTGAFQALQRNLLRQCIETSGPWALPARLGPSQTKDVVDACQISCVVIEASLFRQLGGFYEKDCCTFGEDIYLLIQVVFNSRIYFDLDPLVRFHVEDSELGVKRVGVRPVRPHLLDPQALLDSCPSHHLEQLRTLFAYYRMLETEKFAREGDWGRISSLRRQYRWPSDVPLGLRLREWKIPLRTLAGGLQRSLRRR
jgi:glycosyltransferase involved in cell wall biosynthesis